ncbi:MAG: hypothetical protein Q9192_006586 [Flavoplaca navasiana]
MLPVWVPMVTLIPQAPAHGRSLSVLSSAVNNMSSFQGFTGGDVEPPHQPESPPYDEGDENLPVEEFIKKHAISDERKAELRRSLKAEWTPKLLGKKYVKNTSDDPQAPNTSYASCHVIGLPPAGVTKGAIPKTSLSTAHGQVRGSVKGANPPCARMDSTIFRRTVKIQATTLGRGKSGPGAEKARL